MKFQTAVKAIAMAGTLVFGIERTARTGLVGEQATTAVQPRQPGATAEMVPIANKESGSKATICLASRDPGAIQLAHWCRDFLAKRGFVVEPAVASDPPQGDRGPLWALELREDCPIAKPLSAAGEFLDTARGDAYVLSVSKVAGRPVASIVGRNLQGLRSGVARLVMLAAEQDGQLVAPAVRESRTSFIPIRRLVLCPPGYTGWNKDRLRQYAEQIWLLGFNSVEICAPTYNGYRDDEMARQLTPMRNLLQAIRDNGMSTSLFVWAQCFFHADAKKDKRCWNDPQERAEMERVFRWLAKSYGDLTDHVLVHVRDPGGCPRNGCDDYQTPQELATFLLKEFRKYMPSLPR